jgi:hypothetical protein
MSVSTGGAATMAKWPPQESLQTGSNPHPNPAAVQMRILNILYSRDPELLPHLSQALIVLHRGHQLISSRSR